MLGFMLASSYGASRPGISSIEARIISEDGNRHLETRIQALELACAGLWHLLQTQHGYSEDQLIASIREVDARDGAIDGKAGRRSADCPRCGRKPLVRSASKCSWCGAEVAVEPFATPGA